ncbi:MAG TPA: hypothetical protein VLB84_17880, partial [Bacteroidia bacterium]|nr:hypothetical protein [Bacteroidia bacterium]
MNPTDSLIASYQEKILFLNQQISKEKSHINVIFYARVISFILAFILFFLFIQHAPAGAYLLLPIIIALFLILLKKELKSQKRIDYLKNRIHLDEKEISILNLDLSSFDSGKEFMDKEHPYISDLDIFGNRSIFQLLNRTCTYSGKMRLAKLLAHPFLDKNEIQEQQQAIKCLSTKLEWNQKFIATGTSANENEIDKNNIHSWLQEDTLFSSSFLRIIATALPTLTLLALLLQLMNIIGSGLFTVLFILQLVIIASHLKNTNRIHVQLSHKLSSVEKYASLIQLIESEPYDSIKLTALKQKLSTHEQSASNTIRKLKKLVDALDARLNIVVAVILNGIFLFDVNVMIRIEKWKKLHKDDFLRWIEVIGEFDSFISLGLHAHNNPDHVYAEIETNEFCIHAENTGHPLINKTKLVKNTYSITGLSRIDLLTGANMAGKSTFLRTIGVNLVLARIGLPICASVFRFYPIRLFTSLRTNDSLQENESFFYAELKRLQLLMVRYEQGEKVFFLLDEILKGTNSKDQHAGSEALIKKMLLLNGAGIVATHDVELSKLTVAFP